jgi:hypothetical protein
MSHRVINQRLQHSHREIPPDMALDPEKLPIGKIGGKPLKGTTRLNDE